MPSSGCFSLYFGFKFIGTEEGSTRLGDESERILSNKIIKMNSLIPIFRIPLSRTKNTIDVQKKKKRKWYRSYQYCGWSRSSFAGNNAQVTLKLKSFYMSQVEARKSSFICQHKPVPETLSNCSIFSSSLIQILFSTSPLTIETEKYGTLWSSHIRFCLIIVVLYTSRLVPQGI